MFFPYQFSLKKNYDLLISEQQQILLFAVNHQISEALLVFSFPDILTVHLLIQ